ncbi:MAG TPA: hypothetical protein ENH52_12905 [Nitrospirae bacterium]|nr:hypothetical protein [Nitrospirota bacterium]
MEKTLKDKSAAGKARNKSGIGNFIKRKTDKIRQQQFTCPFCREIVTGLSAMGTHLKQHCT